MHKFFSSRVLLPSLAFVRFSSSKLFTDSHEWVQSSDGVVTVGITNYAQQNLGEVVYVSLPQVEEKVEAKDVIGEVESVKATSNVYTPVSGIIVAVNERLRDEPGLINKSPEDMGWFVKLKTTEEPKNLMTQKEYGTYLE